MNIETIEKEFDEEFGIFEQVSADEAEGTFVTKEDREKVKLFYRTKIREILEDIIEEFAKYEI